MSRLVASRGESGERENENVPVGPDDSRFERDAFPGLTSVD